MTPEQPARAAPSADATTGEAVNIGGSVLLVDDDTAWLADLKGWLEHEHLHVAAISRGEWVPEVVDFHRPNVIVLDLHLPGGDGVHLLQQLQRRWPGLPVIVMTAFGGPEVEQRVCTLGAAGYFDKPFRVADLVAAIRRLATKHTWR